MKITMKKHHLGKYLFVSHKRGGLLGKEMNPTCEASFGGSMLVLGGCISVVAAVCL